MLVPAFEKRRKLFTKISFAYKLTWSSSWPLAALHIATCIRCRRRTTTSFFSISFSSSILSSSTTLNLLLTIFCTLILSWIFTLTILRRPHHLTKLLFQPPGIGFWHRRANMWQILLTKDINTLKIWTARYILYVKRRASRSFIWAASADM